LERCNNALTNKSIDEILRLLPGKNLLNKLAPLAGCKNSLAMARAAAKHLTITDFEKLNELKTKITDEKPSAEISDTTPVILEDLRDALS
jgi:enolase